MLMIIHSIFTPGKQNIFLNSTQNYLLEYCQTSYHWWIFVKSDMDFRKINVPSKLIFTIFILRKTFTGQLVMKKPLPFSLLSERYFYFLLAFFQFIFISWQNAVDNDSLSSKNYDYLYEKIRSSDEQKLKDLYLSEFLKKAKEENNAEELLNAYRNYVHHSPKELMMVYADSMVLTSFNSKDDNLISNAYLSRGIAHYGLKNHKSALEDYLTAYNYSLKENDYYLQHKIKYNIGQIKYYLGFYQDAEKLFKECIEFFKNDNGRAYLNSIHSLALCYNRMGNIGMSIDFVNFGLKEAKRISNASMDAYFLHLLGINEVARENYAFAIENIVSALPEIQRHDDFANETVGFFYLGKAYWKIGNVKKAINYFEKVDQAFTTRNYTRLDLREAYEILIHHHKSADNLSSEIYYTKRLSSVDSLLRENQQHLGINMLKEYDKKQLSNEVEKKDIELQNEKRNYRILLGGSLLIFAGGLVLIYRFQRQQKHNKAKFELLMKRDKSENKIKTDSEPASLHPEVVEALSRQLEKFEQHKKFLAKDLTLAKLAAAFNSNTKYLSVTIHQTKQKHFSEYINDLKIEYLIELLKTDPKFRKYTNAALAQEVGFSSVQRFIKAFKSKTELTPGNFVDQLKRNIR